MLLRIARAIKRFVTKSPIRAHWQSARLRQMKFLVTGAAGFIGFHAAKALLDRGDEVIGLDNLNSYYDVKLKEARLKQLQGRNGFSFHKLDLVDRKGIEELFARTRPQRVSACGWSHRGQRQWWASME